jgi:hypothetical protein
MTPVHVPVLTPLPNPSWVPQVLVDHPHSEQSSHPRLLNSQAASFVGSPDTTDKLLTVGTEAA